MFQQKKGSSTLSIPIESMSEKEIDTIWQQNTKKREKKIKWRKKNEAHFYWWLKWFVIKRTSRALNNINRKLSHFISSPFLVERGLSAKWNLNLTQKSDKLRSIPVHDDFADLLYIFNTAWVSHSHSLSCNVKHAFGLLRATWLFDLLFFSEYLPTFNTSYCHSLYPIERRERRREG